MTNKSITAPITVPMPLDNLTIYSICIAYEQGFEIGHNKRGKQKDNPYPDKPEEHSGHCHIAWDYGWQEGDNIKSTHSIHPLLTVSLYNGQS